MGVVHDLADRVLAEAIAIQQIPAPTFSEQCRAEHVRDRFAALGLADVAVDELGNVFARRPGGAGPALLVSAHTDTVFAADTDLAIRREGDRILAPGLADNSLGVAALLGLQMALDEAGVDLPGDLHLVANVREEGLGDLAGMRRVVDHLADRVAACVVLEGAGQGTVYDGSVGSKRYRITVTAPGGHSWADHGTTSAIHRLVDLAAALARLPLGREPKTTLNIGTIAGGRSVNAIAEDATLELDLRSTSAAALGELVATVEGLVRGHATLDAPVDLVVIGERPASELAADDPLLAIQRSEMERLGIPLVRVGRLSSDAAIPQCRGIPAICLGLARAGKLHTCDEYLEPAAIAPGLELLVACVRRIAEGLQAGAMTAERAHTVQVVGEGRA